MASSGTVVTASRDFWELSDGNAPPCFKFPEGSSLFLGVIEALWFATVELKPRNSTAVAVSCLCVLDYLALLGSSSLTPVIIVLAWTSSGAITVSLSRLHACLSVTDHHSPDCHEFHLYAVVRPAVLWYDDFQRNTGPPTSSCQTAWTRFYWHPDSCFALHVTRRL